MKPLLLAITALTLAGAPGAQAAEVLCGPVRSLAEPERSALQKEFNEIAANAGRWAKASPVPVPCQKPLSGAQALHDATFSYKVDFVTERLSLCDAETKAPTRSVDAVNDPVSGLVLVWDKAWKEALEYEKMLITTHELAGVAGQINEPWTVSICWMFVPLLPGVRSSSSVELPVLTPTRVFLLAGGGGGGGSTGGRGGGDVKMAGFKFRALMLLLERMTVLRGCGMTDQEFEPAVGAWLSEEVRDANAWRAGDTDILMHSLELGKGRKATAAERACLENATK